mmetsp:Transcript_48335/g.100995  ORF Transcript_48335/g.100995 Transcript_48335/m.100995 type:complete len:422 (+) Transcript_48335:246-1511(+)
MLANKSPVVANLKELAAILECVVAFSVSTPVLPVSRVCGLISVGVNPPPMHLSLPPVTMVAVSILERVVSLSINEISLHRAYVSVPAFEGEGAEAVLLVAKPLSLVCGARRRRGGCRVLHCPVAVLEVALPLPRVLVPVRVGVVALAIHEVVDEPARVDVVVVEGEGALAVALVLHPLPVVAVAREVGEDAAAVPLVVLELAHVPRAVAVGVGAGAVHAAAAEGAVELAAVGEEHARLALEALLDEAALQPVAVAVEHGAPPVHHVVHPPADELLVRPRRVAHHPAPVLLVLAPLPLVRVAVAAHEQPQPVPPVLPPVARVDGAVLVVEGAHAVHVVVLELALVAARLAEAVDAQAIAAVVDPPAVELLAVGVDHGALPVHHAVRPFPRVQVAGPEFHDALAVPLAMLHVSFIYSCCILYC